MKLIIDIPEGLKKDFELEQWTALSCMEMKNALINGTPLPKEYGDLIDVSELLTISDIRADGSEFTYVPYSAIENEQIIIKTNKTESEE